MRPTLQDIAEALNVHKATVSRALSGKPGVGEALRKRIVRVARDRGFFPNGTARSLATSHTETIGLVCCDETSDFLTNPFYSKVLSGIADETANHGFSLAFCSCPLPPPGTRQVLPKIMRERRADGFLFVGDQDDTLIRCALNLGYPAVLVDHQLPDEGCDAITIDNTGGARLAMDFLLLLGHRRIAFVGGALRSPSFAERLEGYRRALETVGLPADEALVRAEAGGAGEAQAARLFSSGHPPTAILACNDVYAAGALRAARSAGLRVPGDLSVVGFDDSPRARETWPPLTTMHVDADEMGRAAVRQLVLRLRNAEEPPSRVVLKPRLCIRGSTAAPRAAAPRDFTVGLPTQEQTTMNTWKGAVS